jgi:hypothetical protein
MAAIEVSTAVISPKNNSEKVLERVIRGTRAKIAGGE